MRPLPQTLTASIDRASGTATVSQQANTVAVDGSFVEQFDMVPDGCCGIDAQAGFLDFQLTVTVTVTGPGLLTYQFASTGWSVNPPAPGNGVGWNFVVVQTGLPRGPLTGGSPLGALTPTSAPCKIVVTPGAVGSFSRDASLEIELENGQVPTASLAGRLLTITYQPMANPPTLDRSQLC